MSSIEVLIVFSAKGANPMDAAAVEAIVADVLKASGLKTRTIFKPTNFGCRWAVSATAMDEPGR